MEKIYSVNMLIALFTDFKDKGFRGLSESEVQKALQSLKAHQDKRTGCCACTEGIIRCDGIAINCPICNPVTSD